MVPHKSLRCGNRELVTMNGFGCPNYKDILGILCVYYERKSEQRK